MGKSKHKKILGSLGLIVSVAGVGAGVGAATVLSPEDKTNEAEEANPIVVVPEVDPIIDNSDEDIIVGPSDNVDDDPSSEVTPIPVPDVESYYTLTSNPEQKIYFDAATTPITNFIGNKLYNVTINGNIVDTNSIYSVKFGPSYKDVTSIGDWFMYGNSFCWKNLNSLNYSGLSNVRSVGNSWMNASNGCFPNLSSISFNGMSSLTTVGKKWMDGYGGEGGFANLSSINFSGLNNLRTVGTSWMDGSKDIKCGFRNMKTLIVGDVDLNNVSFSETYFCYAWPSGGTIYGSAASTWKRSDLSDWHTSENY